MLTVLRADGEILYESPALERVLGYKPDDLTGKNAFDYIHPDDLPAILHELEQKRHVPRSSSEVLFRFLHRNGSWRYMEGAAANLMDDPAIGGIVANCRDVTDRVETLRRLAEALDSAEEATELKSRFLANMSHEIRTPHEWSGRSGGTAFGHAVITGTARVCSRHPVFVRSFASHYWLIFWTSPRLRQGKLDIDRAPYNFKDSVIQHGGLFVRSNADRNTCTSRFRSQTMCPPRSW